MKRGTTKRTVFVLNGGPWSGEVAKMPDETMVFSVRGYHGRYRLGRWEDV